MTETGAAFKQWNLHAALQFIGSQPEVAVYVGCMPTNSKNNILFDWKSVWNLIIGVGDFSIHFVDFLN